MKLDIQAHFSHLHEWSPGQTRSRWDYDCPDFTLEDMIAAGDRLFRGLTDRLRAGDIIYVTDAANKRATLIVNVVDTVRHTVAWDIDIAHDEKIILPPASQHAIRWRGPKGGFFCILDASGAVVSRDHRSRDEAERELAVLARSKAA